MGFDQGRIVFSSDTGIYYAGQTVFGKLIFDQGKEKTFRGIYVKIKGFCLVHWRTRHTRTVNGKHETYYVDHTSREEYMNQKTYLIGSEHGEQKISPGHYEFPFQFLIPTTCPSSFEGTNGHIRYEIKAVVDRAFKTDQEKKAVIRIIAPLDLNTEPGVKDPVQIKFDETYYCCCTRSGSVSAVVKLPYGGYVPGQAIPIEVGCENTGSVTIDSITFTLKKETKFHAQGTRTETEEVSQLELGEVTAGSARSFSVELLVPHVDTPNLRACQYIDVDYRLKVTLSPDGCHSNSSQSRNIVIGTIPLIGSNYPQSVQDQIAQQNVAIVNQPVTSPYPGVQPQYPGASPYPSNSPYPGPAVAPYPTNPPYPFANDQSQYPPPYSEVCAGNSSYPGQVTSPYPNTVTEKTPYPGGPTVTPYPSTNAPYPTSNSPYPTTNIPYPNSPYPSTNTPYPTSNSPRPNSNSPYPAPNNPQGSVTPIPTKAPYPTSPTAFPPPAFNNNQNPGPVAPASGLRTGTLGFMAQPSGGNPTMPLLPPGAAIPYPPNPSSNPFTDASAPEASSP